MGKFEGLKDAAHFLSFGLFKKKQSPFTFSEGIENLAGTDGKTGFGAVNTQLKATAAQSQRTQAAMVDNKTASAPRLIGAATAASAGGGTRVIEVPVYLDSREIARATAKYVDEENSSTRAKEANSRFA